MASYKWSRVQSPFDAEHEKSFILIYRKGASRFVIPIHYDQTRMDHRYCFTTNKKGKPKGLLLETPVKDQRLTVHVMPACTLPGSPILCDLVPFWCLRTCRFRHSRQTTLCRPAESTRTLSLSEKSFLCTCNEWGNAFPFSVGRKRTLFVVVPKTRPPGLIIICGV